MTNPFREHRRKILAKQEAERKAAAGEAEPEMRTDLTAQETTRKTLTELSLQLKDIRSKEKKAEFKREHLNDLWPYAEGVVLADLDEDETLPQDNEFMTIMVWAFDAGLLTTGHEMAIFAKKHGWKLPPVFGLKDIEVFVMTQLTRIADEFSEDPDSLPRGLILQTAEEFEDADLHDELGFKVQKMLGELKLETDPEGALAHYKKAVKIKPEKHGLTKKIKELTDRIESQSEQDKPT